MKYPVSLAAAMVAVVGFAPSAQAEMLWQDVSLTYLNGSNYEVGDSDRQVLTFEHAAGHSWGDSFLFVDRLDSDDGFTETYAELSPRLNVINFSDDSFFSGVYVATTWEIGDGFDNYLVGLGTDLRLPGFDFFQLNGYRRSNEFYESNYQLTAAWGLPLGGDFYYDGFLDWSSASTGHAAEMNFTSQLKYNLGPALGYSNRFYVGVEYAHWNNKFGIDGVDERNLNLLLKVHF
ncbi:ion channel protein Tsx [Pseudidiomarina aquimaris]|uniref:ion channel protein Tsx n=1 Tax=Pseudidiomarina aquimaris TaxID=641841 RepID=UPI003A97B9C4